MESCGDEHNELTFSSSSPTTDKSIVAILRNTMQAQSKVTAEGRSNSIIVTPSQLKDFSKIEPLEVFQRLNRGEELNLAQTMKIVDEVYKKTGVFDAGPLLPFFFRLKGKPFSFINHFLMEPMARFSGISRRLMYKCGRQTGKSVGLSLRLVLSSFIRAYTNTVVVLPRFEQAKRLSANYVSPLINESPIRKWIIDPNRPQSVLQRTLKNGSMIFFCHAFLNADSIRGIASDNFIGDEIQDIDIDHIPVIRECLSASDLKLETYTGTPKTFDNTIETLWTESSQAEWIIKCEACNHYNIPNREYGIIKMIGKDTIVCAKCGRPINPATGHWVHQKPEVRHIFSGYHVPQILMPKIYSNPEEWFLIKQKMKYAEHRFWNECLGESFDRGSRLLFPLQLLRSACTLPWKVTPEDHQSYLNGIQRANSREYLKTAMGIDWGGGGVDEISLTAYTVVGLKPTGTMEVIYMECWPSIGQEEEEAKKIVNATRDFNVDFVCHDFGGAGSLREVILLQSGFDPHRIVPFVYDSRRADSSPIVVFHEGGSSESRSYYKLDKSRSLQLLSMMTKAKGLAFPEYKGISDYLDHFATLYFDRMENPRGADIVLVRRSGKRPDDMAHAVNYACSGLWNDTGMWPDLANNLQI